MSVANDFRKKARDGLSGRWATAVITGLVASILGGSSFSGQAANMAERTSDSSTFTELFSSISPVILAVVMGILSMALVWSILILIIGGAVKLGYAEFNLNVVDQREVHFGDLFGGFSRFGQAFLLQLLVTIFVSLWTLLFIIPGIIAAYRYSMAFFILAEHPEMSAMDALRESKQMMAGNKWRLFCLQFSFIGWMILGVITCGIGLLWVNPYLNAAVAAFYRDISYNDGQYA
ncbi:MAG: DUF975 family protein [Lachnospiraceae bacterium]|nr:DUF975 family protein [Lachnospiraceae bacterium]